jgi:RNA polymerase sigma-70 factor (ECF subfamily)
LHTTPISLLQRLREPGQERARERFVDLYTPLLYYWARRRGCQESDAGDFVQEALALLVRKLPEFTYDRYKSFRAWLRAVVHNCWRNLRRRAEIPVDTQAPDPADLPAPETDDPFWEDEYRQHLVRRALDLMRVDFQPTTWQACWRCVVDGLPAATVARDLGISIGAVYMAKSRVLSRLRIELEGLVE